MLARSTASRHQGKTRAQSGTTLSRYESRGLAKQLLGQGRRLSALQRFHQLSKDFCLANNASGRLAVRPQGRFEYDRPKAPIGPPQNNLRLSRFAECGDCVPEEAPTEGVVHARASKNATV
jgi:hypothetical protein